MSTLLDVRDLHVSYGRLRAVRGVSLYVNAGEIVSIVGPNGAGKSTTMLAVAGALTPQSGSVVFAGRSILGVAAEDIVRRGIALVPEGRRIFSRLTVEENLQLAACTRSDKQTVKADFDRVIGYFPFLSKRLSSPAGRLSGGEQQQLAIARALITRPQLMLVDEPSLGLAPLIVDQVYQNLMECRQDGLTLVVVEQSLERAAEMADRIYVLRNGIVQLAGARDELRGGQRLEEAYFGFGRNRTTGP